MGCMASPCSVDSFVLPRLSCFFPIRDPAALHTDLHASLHKLAVSPTSSSQPVGTPGRARTSKTTAAFARKKQVRVVLEVCGMSRLGVQREVSFGVTLVALFPADRQIRPFHPVARILANLLAIHLLLYLGPRHGTPRRDHSPLTGRIRRCLVEREAWISSSGGERRVSDLPGRRDGRLEFGHREGGSDGLGQGRRGRRGSSCCRIDVDVCFGSHVQGERPRLQEQVNPAPIPLIHLSTSPCRPSSCPSVAIMTLNCS